MKKLKTATTAPTLGTVSTADTENSDAIPCVPSPNGKGVGQGKQPGFGGNLRIKDRPYGVQRATSLEAVINDLRDVMSRIGHFPSRTEYRKEGKYLHSNIVRHHGLLGLAKLMGEIPVKAGPKPQDATLFFSCLNSSDCEGTSPPTKVRWRQSYCEPCKRNRGWYD